MAEFKLVSPLLDHMHVKECIGSNRSGTCYRMVEEETGDLYILKHISIPESDANIDALILAGAVSDRKGAHAYFQKETQAIRAEIEQWDVLSNYPNLASFSGYQICQKESGVGFDLYLLSPQRTTLTEFLQDNAMTHLQALNLGIDLCNALCALREAGYIFENLTPDTVFVDQQGRYLIGDLGLVPLDTLHLTSISDAHTGPFTAPELFDIMSGLNETVDIYSAGMILYYIFNGKRLPFNQSDTSPQEAGFMRVSGTALPTAVYADYELTSILQQACAPNPGDRFQDPAALKQALMMYMQRNSISDTLIVPPLEIGEVPEITPETMEEDAALADSVDADGDAAPEAAAEEPLPVPDEPLSGASPETLEQPEEIAPAQEPAEPEPDVQEPEPDVQEPEPEADVQEPVEPEPDMQEAAEEAAAPVETISETRSTQEPADDQAEEKPSAENDAPEAPAEAAPEADNLDSILEQVNAIVEGEPGASVDKTKHSRKKKKKSAGSNTKKKSAWKPILIVILILALLGVGGYFGYTKWYAGELTDLQVVEKTADSVTVSYTVSLPNLPIIATCTDAYGNSFPVTYGDGTATFTGLESGTQYTVNIQTTKLHRLTGSTSLPVSTQTSTEILDFSAVSGATGDSAVLSLVPSGPEPETWTVTYQAAGGAEETLDFSGHTANITGLELGKEYTFTLHAPEAFFLTGETTVTFTPARTVKAGQLAVSAATEDSLTVSWVNTGDAPEQWTVSCTGGEYDQTQTVAECSAVFSEIDRETAYTITVSAEGLETPLTITLGAGAPVISNLTAQALAEGVISIAWESDDDTPEDGWLVLYTPGGTTELTAVVKTSQPSTAIHQAVPGTQYEITIQAADGTAVIGPAHQSVTTAQAEAFAENGFGSEAAVLQFYDTPNETGWTYQSLGEAKTEFPLNSKLCFALLAPSTLDAAPETDTTITYAIRRTDGALVDYYTGSGAWNTLWTREAYTGELLRTPQDAGIYSLEIYFNNRSAAKAEFTLLPAEET